MNASAVSFKRARSEVVLCCLNFEIVSLFTNQKKTTLYIPIYIDILYADIYVDILNITQKYIDCWLLCMLYLLPHHHPLNSKSPLPPIHHISVPLSDSYSNNSLSAHHRNCVYILVDSISHMSGHCSIIPNTHTLSLPHTNTQKHTI